MVFVRAAVTRHCDAELREASYAGGGNSGVGAATVPGKSVGLLGARNPLYIFYFLL